MTGEPVAIGMGPLAGESRRWGERVPPAPKGALRLDLAALTFVDPLYLVRLRAFIDWHAARGHPAEVVPPTSREVCNYLARMGLAEDLPPGCWCALGHVRARELPDTSRACATSRRPPSWTTRSASCCSDVPYGSLRIWSGCGRFDLTVIEGRTQQRRGWACEDVTAGASIRVELRSS